MIACDTIIKPVKSIEIKPRKLEIKEKAIQIKERLTRTTAIFAILICFIKFFLFANIIARKSIRYPMVMTIKFISANKLAPAPKRLIESLLVILLMVLFKYKFIPGSNSIILMNLGKLITFPDKIRAIQHVHNYNRRPVRG